MTGKNQSTDESPVFYIVMIILSLFNMGITLFAFFDHVFNPYTVVPPGLIRILNFAALVMWTGNFVFSVRQLLNIHDCAWIARYWR